MHCQAYADGSYRLRHVATIAPVPGESVEALTARATAALTSRIVRHPSQWLLMYKRWKRVPPGDDRSRYPFYARLLAPLPGGPAGAGRRDGTSVQ